jgi:Na+-transporting NADH:ubiquinone oxidoreductase subunit B
MEENTNKPGLFEKGGKLGFLHSTVDAFDTFLRVPATVTTKGSHVRDAVDLKRVMILVVIALVPAALFGMWNVGYQHYLAIGETAGFWATFWYGFLKVLPLYIVSYVVGLFIEFAGAQIKGEEVNEGYLVSGFLIPLIMPVDVPRWMLAIATAFAVLFGKEVFGGTGMNFLNPALLARAFLFFAYPSKMSGSDVWVSLGKDTAVDGFTGATPLGHLSEGIQGITAAGYDWWNLFAGTVEKGGCIIDFLSGNDACSSDHKDSSCQKHEKLFHNCFCVFEINNCIKDY